MQLQPRALGLRKIMEKTMLILLIVAICLLLLMLIVLLRRANDSKPSDVLNHLDSVEKGLERVERNMREEIASNRQQAAQDARSHRDEITTAFKNFNDSTFKVINETAGSQKRDLIDIGETLRGQVSDLATVVGEQLRVVPIQLTGLTKSNEEKLDSLRSTVDRQLHQLQTDNASRLDQIREASRDDSRCQREEISVSLRNFSETLFQGLADLSDSQRKQSQSLTESLDTGFSAVRGTIDTKLKEIQDNNSLKLDEMRLTVDEKLHGTLEKRLGEAFGLVTGQLEQVHKGLGEMQTLATGVGDLKRALTNVKTRGGWSEVQLGALMEDMLSPTQYDRNFKPNEGMDTVVEYAIKFPNRDGSGEPVWLPIDSKFPIEDYNRLVDAQEKTDLDAINAATKGLETRIKGCAKDICDKYLNPPRTTDFGMMFLPTEGLYAEVIRRASLVEMVRRDYNVTIVGPSTFAAFVSSLQMGFRTLAIQERSSEVWKLLGAVKTQFGKFGAVLEGVKKKLEQATNTMDDAAVRTRAIERKLRDVEELPATEALVLLGETDLDEEAEAA
jgi:DNA recombination protein RmuC